ncbi:MAG TPA: MBL fold metallo-hydrolase [Candidatus Baltobacteraceae bacterium]|jgi:glyoxylase-like metal-dependent hydrolase (beta-lactamase superfamily II)|nr:MBL fold metallo-hydrolase [Candidatus Baltobacteraceae bacterium]
MPQKKKIAQRFRMKPATASKTSAQSNLECGGKSAMLSWQVGNVKITRIVEMDLPVPATVIPQATPPELRKSPWLYPHFVSEDDTTLNLSVHALLIEAPGRRLVVDTCVGNDRPREITEGRPLATPFLQHLAQAGWSRDNVDAVVCTHLHVDHVGWNTMLENGKWTPTFPKARYLIARREYDFWRTYDDEEQQTMLGDSIKPIVDAGLVQLVELDHVISPELRLMPSTGHTPGHVSVMIESKGERAAITGDMMHHPCQFAHPEWVFGDTDSNAAVLTRSRLFAEWADHNVLVIGTHFPAPTAGYIVRDGAAFTFAV